MRLVLLASVLAFLVDQITKYLVIVRMELASVGGIDVLPPLLNFRYGENRGINFGLFDSNAEAARWVLVGIALVICAGVLVWVARTPMRGLARFSAGLLVGGALANVLDRVLYGYVLDFLNMSCCGVRNPFVFNLADVFIFAGAIGLVFFAPDGKGAREKGQ